MLRPILDVSSLNVTLSGTGKDGDYSTISPQTDMPGIFILLYGYVSIKIQQVWYLGEARKHLFCQ
jgi:hypothetical protein